MLRSFFDSADEFNEAYWVLMSSWSGWTLVGLGITTVAILWLAQRNTGSLEPTRRRILLGLRLAAIALIWLVFLQPGGGVKRRADGVVGVGLQRDRHRDNRAVGRTAFSSLTVQGTPRRELGVGLAQQEGGHTQDKHPGKRVGHEGQRRLKL